MAPSTSQEKFVLYAVLAGLFGALSAVAGKLSVSGDIDTNVIKTVLRVGGIAANAFCTAQMWRFYLKALSLGPTAVAQTLNTGTNFAVSALLGITIFGETVTPLWCLGAACCAAGLVLVVSDPKQKGTATPKE